MRFETASQAKGVCRGANGRQMVPREGTRIRVLYDLFMANKGVPIDIAICVTFHGTQVAYLCDFYGLDIRKLTYRRWVLAGEWFGKTYVDYIADRVHAADRQRRRV